MNQSLQPLKQNREVEMAMFSFLARPANIPFVMPQMDLHYVFAYTEDEAIMSLRQQYPPKAAVIDTMGKTPVSMLLNELEKLVDLSSLPYAQRKELEMQQRIIQKLIDQAENFVSNEKEKTILLKVLNTIKELTTPNVVQSPIQTTGTGNITHTATTGSDSLGAFGVDPRI